MIDPKAMNPTTDNVKTPICVDLDGTLVRSDTLWETILQLLKKHPSSIFSLVMAYFRSGRSGFKSAAVDQLVIDPVTLPYHKDVLDFIHIAKSHGHPILLVTGANERLAHAVANHIGLFDDVIGSQPGSNNTGADKAEELVRRFGDKKFDYMGNSHADLKVWKHSSSAHVVGSQKLVNQAALLCPVANHFPAATESIKKSLVKAIRPHQWVKNIIVFLPAVASHRIFEFQVIGNSILAFIAFSLCASGLYVMNDLLDLTSDRLHKSKSKRPFAAGNLPLSWGVAMCPALLLAAFVICIFLPVQYSAVLITYILLTTAYTFYFKSRVLVDVFFLAALYTIRLIAGHEAANLPYSHWLTGFSIFFFLSLALIKRGSELVVLRNSGKLRTDGRGYQTSDVSTICNQGMVAGGLSVLYLAMYVSSPEIHLRYSSPDLLLALCPLLFYWLSRMWLLVDRGWMHHDPVVFALQDRVSYYILTIATIIGLIAITYP